MTTLSASPSPWLDLEPGASSSNRVVTAVTDTLAVCGRNLRVLSRSPAQGAGVPVMFLLVFSSAAFVPLSTMPGWLAVIGAHQPVTALVNAERALLLRGPAAGDVMSSVAWSAGLLAGFAVLATLAYRRAAR